MMGVHDLDEWEWVSTYTPCPCGGPSSGHCNGCCCASASVGLRQRSPEAVALIKAERRKREEDAIIDKAEQIMARRALTEQTHD